MPRRLCLKRHIMRIAGPGRFLPDIMDCFEKIGYHLSNN